MARTGRPGISAEQKNELWQRWKAGDTLSDIGRALGKHAGSIFGVLVAKGGIAPAIRIRRANALTVAEREEIARGLAVGSSIRQLARELGRAPSTICREVSRNGGARRYRPSLAEERASMRALRPKPCRLASYPELCALVADRLENRWSPQQVSGWLKATHPGWREMQLSHETIYRSLFVQARGVLKKDLLVHLRSRRVMRRGKMATTAGQTRDARSDWTASGGNGGTGGAGGTASLSVGSGVVIFTGGDNAPAIIVTANGGAGGNGAPPSDSLNEVGGDGGTGGDAASGTAVTVTIASGATISTTGFASNAIVAQSLGGAGADGASVGGFFNSSGGAGSAGGTAGYVYLNTAGTITTSGDASIAVVVQSVAGGGGNGGSSDSVISPMGGNGAASGDAGGVTAINRGSIRTNGNYAHGILAQSVGGGGGSLIGGAGSSISVGGTASSGGTGGGAEALVRNYGAITTQGNFSDGILAQSIGGGGGNGGGAGGLGSLGGQGASGGNADVTKVYNANLVSTSGENAIGIAAQSIGGGGGRGGGAMSVSVGAAAAIGGGGGAGGDGGGVYVRTSGTTSSTITIATSGDYSTGILAQSIGGGGGAGGNALAADIGVAALAIGGTGGSGGSAATVTVINNAGIQTSGDRADAIIAQSVGGGGGTGGSA
ncbi:MAG: hypothetical protein B7Y02_01680, partial [Rhodobacterales bacterium 17-64-5]